MNIVPTSQGVSFELGSGDRLPVSMILGIGLNYAPHAHEQGVEPPDRPVVFTKNLAAATVHGAPIRMPAVCMDQPQVDFEGELAFVIREAARDVSEDDALSYVLGYTVANDVSARWWQKKGSGKQFFRGKSFDTFCPLGPKLVPASEVDDPQTLRLRTWLNDELMQEATTGDMIFTVRQLISDLSRGMTLLPGTVVLTGTPSGVGFARTPPVFLRGGDRVAIEISRIGRLENLVEEEGRG